MTITAGVDRSKTNLGGDRADFIWPAFVYSKKAWAGSGSACTGSGACVPWLNNSLFARAAVGSFGNIGKNIFRGPARWNVDMGLIKNFYPMTSHENVSVQFRGEIFNLFNHTQLNDPTTAQNSGNFGGIRGAGDPRIIQIALKLFF